MVNNDVYEKYYYDEEDISPKTEFVEEIIKPLQLEDPDDLLETKENFNDINGTEKKLDKNISDMLKKFDR